MRHEVHQRLLDQLRKSPLHFTLLDPEKASPEKLAATARAASRAGSNAILVGGSTGVHGASVDAVVKAVKAAVDVPVILFPHGADGLTARADAIFYMTMLNSRSPKYLIEEQVAAAERIHEMGLEVLPMGYVVVAPGGRVGEVGEARLLARDQPGEAVKYALAAQYFGMDYVYLEAGSGATEPIPTPMVKAVKRVIEVPLIVGGGIRSAASASALIEAGADVIVTGNVLEENGDVHATLAEILHKSVRARSPRGAA